jgi:hypothetical protein
MHKKLSCLACAIAVGWAACGDSGRVPSDTLAGTSRVTPAANSLQPGGGERVPITCQRGDFDVLGIALDARSFEVEVAVTRDCTVGLASYERPGGGSAAQTKFQDSGGKLLASGRSVLQVALPCGAWQTDLYFNLTIAPDVPTFHGGNFVRGWTGATSCSIPPRPPICNPPCDARDICVNGICLPPPPQP